MNKAKDEFFIELTRVVSESQSTFEKINRIQKLSHHFLKSEKSSLYLIDVKNPDILHLQTSTGYSRIPENVKSASSGTFGYVLQNRRPLFIEDINQDYRFEAEEAAEVLGFRSGACMVFPLISEGRVLGVMSFSEKEGQQIFASSDLELGIKMSSFVALLISSSKEYKIAI